MKKHALLVLALSAALLSTGCGRDVTIVIPEQYAKNIDISGFELGDNDDGYKSRQKNEDGSVTIVFTKKQYQELQEKMHTAMEESMKRTDSWEHVSEVKASADYSHFTFITQSEQLDLTDYLVPAAYVMLGNMYTILNGNPEPAVSYDFVYEKTGEVIYSYEPGNEATDETAAAK